MPNSDYLLAAVREQLPNLQTIYRDFEDKRPVLLLDIREEQIHAYPFAAFSRDLSEPSQRTLREKYEKADREQQIVVFVRDNAKRRLVSVSVEGG
ncbi:MAG: hypothetical protein ACJ8F7_03525 [Gemmataceae bacterium]